jgi:hypothetical protein
MPVRAPLAVAAALLLLSARPLGATTPSDQPWPPDPGVFAPPGTEVAPGLRIGDTLEQSNADLAKDLLPPEVLAHYRSGGYRNPIVSFPTGIYHYETDFVAATKENDGKYDVEPGTGTIIEKATGKPPAYIYGIPFPTLSADDPNAGLKALWNQFHSYWNQGNVRAETLIVWANPDGVDRVSTNDVNFQYYENQAPEYRAENPQDFTWQFIAITRTPADLEGTVAMSFRYRDPKKRDSVWSYVPAMRRVRPVSPANRSDGFLGSDLSQDDGNFFDAKPEDFVWKTVGLRESFRMVDPVSILGKAGRPRWMPETGYHNDWPPDVPAAGYMKEGWKGLAWAPVSGALAKRKFWVVEGVPRDRYYLFGRLELWIDAETWTGSWNRKFSWKGELLNTYGVQAYLNHPTSKDGSSKVEWLWASQQAWQCAENVKMNRATLAGIRARPDGPLDRRVTHNIAQLFNLQSLARFGK